MIIMRYKVQFDYDKLMSLIDGVIKAVKEDWFGIMLIICLFAGIDIIVMSAGLMAGIAALLMELFVPAVKLYVTIKDWIRDIHFTIEEDIEW